MKTNSENDILDLLGSAWQRQGRRLDQAAGSHPVTVDALRKPRPLRRREVAGTVVTVALCLAGLVVLSLTYGSYVVDLPDSVAHLIVAAILIAVAIRSLMSLRRMARPVEPLQPGTGLVTALLALLLVVATPAYAGRTMQSNSGSRSETIAQIDLLFDKTDSTEQ